MKISKTLAVLLAVAVLICMTGFTANAATNAASYNVSAITVDGAVNTKAFDGYNVTVLDKTTPAVSVRGRTNDRNVMCFVSAADQEVGAISHSDYNAIIQKNRKVVNLPGGGSYGVPPVDGKSWEDWFADEYNKYRGISAESKEASIDEANKTKAATNAELAEKYRQEVVRLVNKERENVGAPSLYADDKAMEYAQIRAQELATSYSHTRPNGLEKPYNDLDAAINENIAMGQSTPESVIASWMSSPGHRGNILAEDMYAIGVGCYFDGNTIYWSQEFLW